ncbi:unnamed protein product [Cuscuta campestris]|uniref:Protein kinase domain-containing protein n=1 Tax=Cuscuta campestris TaxID=132261 RepID=A0A484KG73_9ASTE|nr:unnamed protein product [Cuscuta campestris]
MHLKSLCFILPADETEPVGSQKPGKESATGETGPPEPPRRGCGGQALDFIRQSLHRVLVGKNRSSGEFHDADGVGISGNRVGADNPRIFSYAELFVGTKGFAGDQVLGSGGFGKVYRAVLPSDGTEVAVKCCLAEKGEKFEKTFAAELAAVAHLRHRNLVKLRGWCVDDDRLLLVYEYMPNRSLDRVLFKKTEHFLDWEKRKKIVKGLAAALFYLHEQLETQIIHRDVKTSNVMLDSGFNARLGDFGLARWQEHRRRSGEPQTRTPSTKNQQFRLAETTKIGGTIGYLPPESFQRRGSIATAKSDVFSFGIVSLEVASGRRAVDLACPDDQIVLLDWVRRLSDDGAVLQAGDVRLADGSFRLVEMERLIQIGLLCTLQEPHSRPNMKWVLEALNGEIVGKLPNPPSFKSHPLYISFSSSSSSSSRSSPETFFSASAETGYLSAESGISGKSITNYNSANRDWVSGFPAVETPREFAFKEIMEATDRFSERRRVAEVDFGTAYRGFLAAGGEILVKRLGMKTCPALRTRFSDELRNMGRLRHRNLVQLRGWCTEHGEMLVVYEYSPARLLSHLLFRHGGLRWHHRYNIIKSLASAIHYLHEEWEEQVIHRCITSSAVVLDAGMNPRLGSFALAEFLARNEQGNHHVVVDKNKSVRGIFGYMSPEHMDSGEATAAAADVYSYGVVLLEILTGEPAVDFRRPEVLLVHKLHKFEQSKRPYEDLADRRLDGGEIIKSEFIRAVRLGIACTRSDPTRRPSMRQIVRILDGHDEWFVKNGLKKETGVKWRKRNASSLSHVRRMQALGIH